jgi:hypothetical protein
VIASGQVPPRVLSAAPPEPIDSCVILFNRLILGCWSIKTVSLDSDMNSLRRAIGPLSRRLTVARAGAVPPEYRTVLFPTLPAPTAEVPRFTAVSVISAII